MSGAPAMKATLDPVPAPDIPDILRRMPLLSGFRDDELRRLERGCHLVVGDRGQVLFRKGDPCRGFYLVVAGQIKLAFSAADGHQKVVEILRPRQSFGEEVMFIDLPFVLMAQALTDCQLLFIGKKTLFAELDRTPVLARKLLSGLSFRLHHLICELENHRLRSGKERIISYLLCEEEQQKAQPAGYSTATLLLPTTKEIIASQLNMTQEHFSRMLHELNRDGLIEVQGRTIRIPDLARFRAALG